MTHTPPIGKDMIISVTPNDSVMNNPVPLVVPNPTPPSATDPSPKRPVAEPRMSPKIVPAVHPTVVTRRTGRASRPPQRLVEEC